VLRREERADQRLVDPHRSGCWLLTETISPVMYVA
jgi:hypothetical protein